MIKSGTAPVTVSAVAPPVCIDCPAKHVVVKNHQNCDIHQPWSVMALLAHSHSWGWRRKSQSQASRYCHMISKSSGAPAICQHKTQFPSKTASPLCQGNQKVWQCGSHSKVLSLIFFANPARWVYHLWPFHIDTTRQRNWYSVELGRGGHWTKLCFKVEFAWDASDWWTARLCAVHLWFMFSMYLSLFT